MDGPTLGRRLRALISFAFYFVAAICLIYLLMLLGRMAFGMVGIIVP